MPTLKPIAGSDALRPLKSEWDVQRYTPTPRRIALPVPLPGIFEEPYRCIIVNKEWWSHVSGMIDVLSSEELWLGTDDDKTRALREIAALLAYDDCGGFGMTPDELKEAVCEALECWTENTALKIVSGVTGGFQVDDDGNVIIGGGDSDAGLPEDDPGTQIDETEAGRYGAMVEIAAKIELLLDKADAYFGVPSGAVTPVTSLEDATAALISYFPCDHVLMTTAVDNYYTWRLDGATQMNFNGGTALPLYMYCNGYDYNALARYIIDESGYVPSKQQIVLKFWESLADSFFSHYFAEGATKPTSGYLDAPCVPIEIQTLLNLVFGVQRATTIVKAGHRMKFRWTGYALDADGDIQDTFWYRTAAGVNTWQPPTFVHGAGANLPSQTQVPYRANHIYEYTIDLADLGANPILITLNKHANMNAVGLTYPTPFDVTIEDLGLAISQ